MGSTPPGTPATTEEEPDDGEDDSQEESKDGCSCETNVLEENVIPVLRQESEDLLMVPSL